MLVFIGIFCAFSFSSGVLSGIEGFQSTGAWFSRQAPAPCRFSLSGVCLAHKALDLLSLLLIVCKGDVRVAINFLCSAGCD